MTIALGIDTGGTYTDAALVDNASGEVLASAKSLTTRHDLSVGIGKAIGMVFEESDLSAEQISLIALSTTFATNAIVEGQGSPVCLLLIGYDTDLIKRYGFEREFVTQNIIHLRGGHNGSGDEVAPLDEKAVREAVLAQKDKVEAFAVSGYFSILNPTHELRVREIIEELTGLPVTCGHELTTKLNSVRRATTAALNAALIPLLRRLISSVSSTLKESNITAPLMVVKGDGSLVRAEWAMQRPIETILSGPAASTVGAQHLAGRGDVWVVDMGGTTTDIGALRDGRPRLNPEGAQVGGWRTMVKAVDMHTVGLGGDSHVRLSEESHLLIGPRRVVPLCLLANQFPKIVDELQWQVNIEKKNYLSGQFVFLRKENTPFPADRDARVWEHLSTTPQSLHYLTEKTSRGSWITREIEKLEKEQLILRSAFTPTDALHFLGYFDRWNAKASQLGAKLLADQMRLSPDILCEQIIEEASYLISKELLSKILGDETEKSSWDDEPLASALLDRALGRVAGSDLGCQCTLQLPIAAVGAPVKTYFPKVAEHLHTELVIPPHAHAANAVGAVVGGVVQELRVRIRPIDDKIFRLHLPDGIHDFRALEEAVEYAQEIMQKRLKEQALQVGAEQVEVQIEREDQNAEIGAGWDTLIYLGTDLTFTAVGRPSPTL